MAKLKIDMETLEALGIDRKHIEEQLVVRLVDTFLGEHLYVHEEEDDAGLMTTETKLDLEPIARRIHKEVGEKIDVVVGSIAKEVLGSNIEAYIETLLLEEANRWGEPTGNKWTIREYIVHRAEEYLREQVDSDGRSKAESRGSMWTGKQARAAYMVDRHLHYAISSALKEALKNANSRIVEGLEETVKIKLKEISKALKVEVKT